LQKRLLSTVGFTYGYQHLSPFGLSTKILKEP
jgi:hypothetical protein